MPVCFLCHNFPGHPSALLRKYSAPLAPPRNKDETHHSHLFDQWRCGYGCGAVVIRSESTVVRISRRWYSCLHVRLQQPSGRRKRVRNSVKHQPNAPNSVGGLYQPRPDTDSPAPEIPVMLKGWHVGPRLYWSRDCVGNGFRATVAHGGNG